MSNDNGKKDPLPRPLSPEEEQARAEELLKGKGSEGENEESSTPPPIVLQITLDPLTSGLNVAGPIDNKVLCYGMLELAKDAVREFAGQKKQQREKKAPLLHLPFSGKFGA